MIVYALVKILLSNIELIVLFIVMNNVSNVNGAGSLSNMRGLSKSKGCDKLGICLDIVLSLSLVSFVVFYVHSSSNFPFRLYPVDFFTIFTLDTINIFDIEFKNFIFSIDY